MISNSKNLKIVHLSGFYSRNKTLSYEPKMVRVSKLVNVYHFNYAKQSPPLTNMEQITFQTFGKNKP